MPDGSGNQVPTEVIAAAQAVVDATVWATLTIVGADLRPRSRLVHPVWEEDVTVIDRTPHRIVVRPLGAPMLAWRAAD